MEEKRLIRKQIFAARKQCSDAQVEEWSAAYHVNLQDEWLAQMSKKYGEGNIRVVERALKTL